MILHDVCEFMVFCCRGMANDNGMTGEELGHMLLVARGNGGRNGARWCIRP